MSEFMSWNATANCLPSAQKRQYTVSIYINASSISGSSPSVAEKQSLVKLVSKRAMRNADFIYYFTFYLQNSGF